MTKTDALVEELRFLSEWLADAKGSLTPDYGEVAGNNFQMMTMCPDPERLARAITALPTPWWTERGEATRRRCLAVCQAEGYALVQSDTDRFSAGCRNNLTRAQALAHWNRSDARAKLFTAAIEGAML